MVVHEYVFLVYIDIVEVEVDYALEFLLNKVVVRSFLLIDVFFTRIECEYE